MYQRYLATPFTLRDTKMIGNLEPEERVMTDTNDSVIILAWNGWTTFY